MKVQAKVIYIFIVFLAFTACEDVDLTGEETGNVQGLWQLTFDPGNNTFVLISDTEFNYYYYDGLKKCLTIEKHTVVDIDPQGFYTVREPGSDVNMVYAVSRSGDRIHLRDIDVTQSNLEKYFPSTVDIENFAPECFRAESAGLWELESETDEEYLFLSEDIVIVTAFLTDESCYAAVGYDVIEIDGPDLTIQSQIDGVSTLAINAQVVDSVLTTKVFVADPPEEYTYKRTQVTQSDLSPVCERADQ